MVLNEIHDKESISNTTLIWALVLIHSGSVVTKATDHLSMTEDTI